MPKAYGRDTLRVDRDGSILLRSVYSKGWTPSKAQRHGGARRHPGTAILWEDTYYEVVSAEGTADGSVQYRLVPWRDEEVIRHSESYDPQSEGERARRWQRRKDNEGLRKWLVLLSPLTGLLPRSVQEEMNREIGTPPLAPTFWSALLCISYGGYCIVWLFAGADLGKPRPPLPPLGAYLFLEGIARMRAWLLLNQAAGSALGFLAYAVWYVLGGRSRQLKREIEEAERRRNRPPDRYQRAHQHLHDLGKGGKAFKGVRARAAQLPDEVVAADYYRLREPLLSFLSEREQLLLEWRLGFQPIRSGKNSAILILFFSLLGIGSARWFSSPDSSSTGFALLVAIILAVEQIVRLVRLHGGKPAPSLLGVLIRPFVAGVFSINPSVLSRPDLTAEDAMELAKERARVSLPDVWDDGEG